MRNSFKDKLTSNKQNREFAHYSFSKNVKSQLIDKPSKKSNNFVDRVDGYIEMISPHQPSTRHCSRDNKSVKTCSKTRKYSRNDRTKQQKNRQTVLDKVKVEREMNRNLQKCIIEIQKMLWDRNDRLEQLQQQLKESDKFFGKKNYQEQEQASNISCKRVKDSHKELKRQVNTLGLRQLLSRMENQSDNGQSFSNPNVTSQSQLSNQHQYIKIRRPRTESQSESVPSKRKK